MSDSDRGETSVALTVVTVYPMRTTMTVFSVTAGGKVLTSAVVEVSAKVVTTTRMTR